MVLFVSYSGLFGGAERLLVDFATALAGEPAVACPEGPLARAARARGLRVFGLRGHEPALRVRPRDRVLAVARLAAHAVELDQLVHSLEPELLVAWSMRSAIACRLLPKPRSAFAFQHNDFLPGPLIGSLVRWAAARAVLITVPSNAVAADLDPAGGLGGRLRVIHPGVDLDRLAAAAPPAVPPEVLVLGALVNWKRPDIALEACALVRRSRPDVRLRLIGAPLDNGGAELLAQLRARADKADLAGAVELAGQADEPRAALGRATCVLHCAPREPFGIAVLEALAVGRPAIAPAAGGPAEIVDPSCGILYSPGDAEAAAKAILEILDDPERAARMGAAGRDRARTHFDRAAARTAYANAVHPVLGGSRRHAGTPNPRAARSDLSLVTVTYNSATHLRRLLSSVQRHLPGTRVIVVDCGSEDDSIEVARACPSTAVVALDANLGFGAGCNRGIASARTAVTALVNPDVELIDDSLLALTAEAMRRDQPERLLAPLVLDPDGARQDSVHPVPTAAADLVRSLVPPALLPGRLGIATAPWRARTPRPVGWAIGCALVARTETFLRLGGFDERYFMFGEDLELGLRARQSGVQTWFWPECRVIHDRAHSTRATFGGEPFESLARARHSAVASRLGARRADLDDVAQALTFASRGALKRAIGHSSRRERRQLEAVLSLRRARRASGTPAADERA